MTPKTCELFLATSKIIFLQNSGLCYREIGKKINLTLSSNRCEIKKKKETGSTVNKWWAERPRTLDTGQRRDLIKGSAKNPFLNARESVVDVTIKSGITVTPQTIRNILHAANIWGKTLWKKKGFVKQIGLKDLILKKLRPTNHWSFWKMYYFSRWKQVQ